ncbi:MAG TPA: peptidyl-prolyl cis-trans isomerase [Terriglobales bacterium]
MIRFLQTPGPIKKIILGGLMLLVCVFMVITLIPGVGSSTDLFGTSANERGVIAKVDGETVTTLEVQRAARGMIQQQFPRGGPEVAAIMPLANRQAAETLITQKAMLAEAHRMGLHVTDEELSDELQHGQYSETFFPSGKFIGQDAYQALLERADLTIPQFEQSMKDDILRQKLMALVAGSVTIPDADVHKEFEKQNTKVKFDYAFFTKDEVMKTLHPADAELRAFYEQNKQMYENSIPEQRKISYIVLDEQSIASKVTVSDDEIRSYYQDHLNQYVTPEQVNVSQILIKQPLPGADGKVDQKATEAAQNKANDVLKQLKAGGNFAELAKKYSEDPSGKSGGSIGWVQHGGFPVADVDKAAFSLAKGATSDVINAGYAFVILRVDDKKAAHNSPIEDVKSQIVAAVQQEKAGQEADNQAQALLNTARNGGLEKAAASQGLQVVTTDFVDHSANLPGVGNAPAFMDAIFGAQAKAAPEEGQVPSGYAIYQVLDVKAAATPTFEAIKSKVEEQFKNQRVSLVLSEKTQELSDHAKAQHDLKKAAKDLGATFKSSDFVLPNGQVPDIGSMTGPADVAFTLQSGQISGPINSGNNAAVLEVTDRQPPAEQDYAAKKDSIREGLIQNKQQELFGLFVSNLRDQMEKSGKIKINQNEYKALTKMQNGEPGE